RIGISVDTCVRMGAVSLASRRGPATVAPSTFHIEVFTGRDIHGAPEKMRRRFIAALIVFTPAAPYAQTPVQRPGALPITSRAPQMAAVDSALFKGLKYRLVGPSR